MTIRVLLIIACILPQLLSADAAMLATRHHNDIEITDYFVSEKLDGVRARWNGQQLLSKTGNPIFAPQWFIANFPRQKMDGELWLGRNQFQAITRIVLDDIPDESAWRQVKYMIFDLPDHTGPFKERVTAMRDILNNNTIPHLNMIAQIQFNSTQTLKIHLQAIEAAGGEGLMLHHKDNLYTAGRSAGLLKLKTHDDAEAIVLGYTQGKGRFAGLVGALRVKTADGILFKLGSGLSLQDRKNPPPIGSQVTYKYYGITQSGKPRFASFLRRRMPE